MSTDDHASDARGADAPTNVRGRRIGAVLIDVLVLIAPSVVIAFAFLEKRGDLGSCDQLTDSLRTCLTVGDDIYAATGGRMLAWQLVSVLVGVAYFVVLQGRTGWTFGKLAVGIRVTDGSGAICGLQRAFVRYLPFLVPALIPILGAFLGFVVVVVEFILILANNRRQRMGDIFAKSFVVRQEAVGRPVA